MRCAGMALLMPDDFCEYHISYWVGGRELVITILLFFTKVVGESVMFDKKSHDKVCLYNIKSYKKVLNVYIVPDGWLTNCHFMLLRIIGNETLKVNCLLNCNKNIHEASDHKRYTFRIRGKKI